MGRVCKQPAWRRRLHTREAPTSTFFIQDEPHFPKAHQQGRARLLQCSPGKRLRENYHLDPLSWLSSSPRWHPFLSLPIDSYRAGLGFGFSFFCAKPKCSVQKAQCVLRMLTRTLSLGQLCCKEAEKQSPLLSMLLHSKAFLHWWYFWRYVEVKGWSWHSEWIPFEASDHCLGLGQKGKASLPTPNTAAPRGGEFPTEWIIPF